MLFAGVRTAAAAAAHPRHAWLLFVGDCSKCFSLVAGTGAGACSSFASMFGASARVVLYLLSRCDCLFNTGARLRLRST